MEATKIEATDAAKKLLLILHPDRKEMPAAEAMSDVAEVLALAQALKRAYDAGNTTWPEIAAVAIREVKEKLGDGTQISNDRGGSGDLRGREGA